MHLSFSTFSLTRCCVDSTSVCEDHVLSTTTIPRLSWRISAVRLLFLSVENENTMIRFFFQILDDDQRSFHGLPVLQWVVLNQAVEESQVWSVVSLLHFYALVVWHHSQFLDCSLRWLVLQLIWVCFLSSWSNFHLTLTSFQTIHLTFQTEFKDKFVNWRLVVVLLQNWTFLFSSVLCFARFTFYQNIGVAS